MRADTLDYLCSRMPLWSCCVRLFTTAEGQEMLVKFLQFRVPWLLKATLKHKVGLPALCRETAELNEEFSCAFIRERKFCLSGKLSVSF